ncbi:MAG: hypothetical protein ABIE42_09360 [Candidatus Eisenbacteria bacterium]
MPVYARARAGARPWSRLSAHTPSSPSRSLRAGFAGGVCVALLALLLPTVSHAGSIERRGGFRELSVSPADALNGVVLPDVFVIAGSDSVRVDGELLARGADYTIDYDTGSVTIESAIPDGGAVLITYRYIPLELTRFHRRAVLESLAALPAGFADDALLLERPDAREDARPSAHGLSIGGAKTFGITVGSNRDASLEQSLRLNISGRVTRDVSVAAYLSDQNTPLVPEGDTEELRALDKVLIEIEGENVSATMGDYALEIAGGPLADFRRDETGAKLTASLGRTSFTLAGARATGQFNTLTFRGVDGKQGAYLLTDASGGAGVTVVAGSERVWIDGVRMTRGRDNDYVIDYSGGAIEFTEHRPVVSENEITVDYEFTAGDYARDTYAGRVSLSSTGGAAGIGLSFFRESDDRDASASAAFSSKELAVLAAAGDDPELAHDDGVDSVGVGKGDYSFVAEGVFEYAGPDSGDYDLHFEREDGGDYVYEYVAGHYTYVGLGEGEYGLGQTLPMPTDHALAVVDGRLDLAREGYVEVSGAVSDLDRNTYSSHDDDDNLGNAQVLSAALPRIGVGALDGTELGFSLDARRVAGGFRGVGRFREPGYVERWELEGLALPEGEELLEGTSSLLLGGGGRVELSHAYLTRGDALTSSRTEFSADGRPTEGGRMWSSGRFVESRWVGAAEEVRRERTLYRGGFEQEIGPVRPGVSYAHDERGEGDRGERYDEYGASVESARPGAISFGVSYARRLTDRTNGSKWKQASTTQTQEYRLGTTAWDKLRLAGSVVRRRVDFEEGFEDPASRYDLASVTLDHTSLGGGLTGQVRYSVTATEVEEKQKLVTEEDGVEIVRIVRTGDYRPVTDLSASTRWKFRPGTRGRGGRSMPEPTALGRFLSTLTVTSDLKLREMTTTDEKRGLYLLDPSVIMGMDTVRGEITGRHVARYLSSGSSLSLRLALNTKDVLDRSYSNESTRRKERSGTADVKLTRAGGVTYRLQGDAGTREEDAAAGDSYEIDERSLLAEVDFRKLGDLEARLTASVGRQDAALSGVGVTVFKVTPTLTFRLAGRGALSASVTRIEVEASGGTLDGRPYLAEGRRAGQSAEWRLAGDYRFNQFLTGSLSYFGEARPGGDPLHTLDFRVNAFF